MKHDFMAVLFADFLNHWSGLDSKMSGRVRPHIARKVFECIVVMRNKNNFPKLKSTIQIIYQP